MAHAQKPDFVFRRNGRVHLNLRGRQFSRLLAAEVCASAVVMLDAPRSEVVWRVLATHSIRQFPLHSSSRASPYAITFQLESTNQTHSLTLPPFLSLSLSLSIYVSFRIVIFYVHLSHTITCGCFGNVCSYIYCVLYCLDCVFCIVWFRYIYSYLFCLY